ncbi:myo-inosose-2 dehydratase [Gluconobacter japonicus]|uniref:myo-inosose-2 dehydratase n=1 Tax=Gluconobacter japonicus TaxID=376620 RepID=UPI0007820FBE|nr:myo-inosose-2 dehydratase [Gluconobacter japonicus]KXV28390.1 myo-inosose-2 dehydratase [Gluconobacter japonicus]
MPIKIGANPIIWSNDDMPSLGGDISLETCLSEAREAGIEGMELGNKFPRVVSQLKAALAPYGLELVSGWYSTDLLIHSAEEEIERMQPHLQLLKALGAPVFIAAETSNAIHSDVSIPLSRRPVLSDREWPEFARRMTLMADAVTAEGLDFVYHHHMGTVVQSRQDIDTLMSLTGPSVKLLLDTGHALWGGSDPTDLARVYRDRIGHVHVKDLRAVNRAKADAEDWSFLQAIIGDVFTVPGDGCIDYAKVFAEIPDYSDWVVIEAEQYSKDVSPLTYVRMGRNHLVNILSQTGHLSCLRAS